VSAWCELDPNTRKHTKIGFTNLMWGDYNVAVLTEIKQIYTQPKFKSEFAKKGTHN